ncbi:hypothetical protein F4212_13320 [Candidatus Poribacteria bacterium]|nr:hypothetical protein [Candidatus Poribacteria bacterium]
MKRVMCLHNLIFGTISLFIFTVSVAALIVSAELHHNTLTVEATDRENWTYVSLIEGEVVDINDAATSLKWDIGFKRTSVIVNGGVSGPGKSSVLALEDTSFEDILEAPVGDYVSDTEEIATIARGDGWYTYTGPPNHWILPNEIVYVLQTATGDFAKLRFTGYYENNDTKEGSGNIGIEYVMQDDGSRNFIKSEPTDVRAKQKLTTTWADIKQE